MARATLISSGTLQVGNSGTSGSVAGSITDNATLAFGRSDVYTYTGAISGTGNLTQLGPGTLVLTAANTYGGATMISAGTMQLGSGTAAGSLPGDVADYGTLAFNRSDSYSYAGTISGTGTVSHLSSGMLTLSGSNSYSGLTTVAAGTLQLGNPNALGPKQANAEGVRDSFFGEESGDTLSGRRRKGRNEVPGGVVFHVGLGCTQCGWG